MISHSLIEETPNGPVRVEDLYAPRRCDGRGGEALPGTWLPGAPKGRPRQAPHRLLPGRHWDDKPAWTSGDVRGRRRSARALDSRVREQGFRRGFRLEVPAIGNDPGSQAAPGRAVGTASVMFLSARPLRLGSDCRRFAPLRQVRSLVDRPT